MSDDIKIETPGSDPTPSELIAIETPGSDPTPSELIAAVTPEPVKPKRARATDPVKPEEVGKPEKGRWALFEYGWDWVGKEQEEG